MIAALIVLSVVAASGDAAAREKVVVLRPAVNDPKAQATADLLAEQLLTELAGTGRFEVVGESDLAVLLGVERQRQVLGCNDEANACAAEIGAAMGAPWLISSSLSRAGSKLRVDMKLISTRQARAVSRAGRALESEEQLFVAVSELVRELLGALPAPAGAVVEEAGAPRPRPRWVPWALTAVGGVAAIVGVALTVHASSAAGGLEARKPTLYWSELSATYGGYQREYWAGVSLAIAGGLLLIGGLLWAVLGAR